MLLPLVVGAGLLALLVAQKPAAPTTPAPGTMPPALKTQYDDLLANGINADGLKAVADQLDTFGFTSQAATLRARAAQLLAAQVAAANRASGTPAAPPAFIPTEATPPPVAPRGVCPPGMTDVNGGVGPLNCQRIAPLGSSADPTLNVPSTPLTPGLTIPLSIPAPPSLSIQQARVTTQDPAPAGDLIIRSAPDPSAAQLGGAEKDGVVTIVNQNASPDGVWSQIVWPGGSRLPPAAGFARSAFLSALPPSPTVSGIVVGAAGTNYAKCVAPSGCRLRLAPNTASTFRALVENGATVQVLLHAKGDKADYGSPGPGGWAKVQYKGILGWLPSEWLQAGP